MKTINLIRTKTALSPQVEMAAAYLRKLSLWALVILIVSGVVVSGIFYYLRVRQDQLVNTHRQLSESITQNTTKEGLLFTVKQRAALTNKILGIQQPVSKVFDTLSTVNTSGQMTDVSLDDHNTVLLTIHAESITDVVTIADALMGQVKENRVRSPQLVSLSLGKSGGVDVSLSFIAVF
jgi:hypothetical protein